MKYQAKSPAEVKGFNYISTVLNLMIYFSAGIAAPFFFKNMADRKQAAFMAGGLFSLTALRAVRLSMARPYSKPIKRFFFALLLVEFSFWVWRLQDPRPLSEIFIGGQALTFIHPLMSCVYLISCVVIVYAEWGWLRATNFRGISGEDKK